MVVKQVNLAVLEVELEVKVALVAVMETHLLLLLLKVQMADVHQTQMLRQVVVAERLAWDGGVMCPPRVEVRCPQGGAATSPDVGGRVKSGRLPGRAGRQRLWVCGDCSGSGQPCVAWP